MNGDKKKTKEPDHASNKMLVVNPRPIMNKPPGRKELLGELNKCRGRQDQVSK